MPFRAVRFFEENLTALEAARRSPGAAKRGSQILKNQRKYYIDTCHWLFFPHLFIHIVTKYDF